MQTTVQMARAVQPTQAAVAHFCLDGKEITSIQIDRGMEYCLAVIVGAENTVSDQHMKVDVAVERVIGF